MRAPRPAAILIAGPTASGKSALAIALARRLGSVVVNADSMQVYRDLRILTARPNELDEAKAAHRLFGHIDGGVNYSVGAYLGEVEGLLSEEKERHERVPIFVGGTGLYFSALLRGLSNIPIVPDIVRARVRMSAEGLGSPDLHARLAASDPVMAARLRPTDSQRILRALEVLETTGRSLAEFQATRQAPLLEGDRCVCLFLAVNREELNARIDARFSAMLGAGALEEVRRLRDRQLDPALPVMRAHGVPGLVAYLDGRSSLEEAIARGRRDTRNYAKRQFTFARHQLPTFAWVPAGEAQDHVLRQLAA